MKTPRDLDTITDVVLNYRPKSKSKAAKKRARKKKRDDAAARYAKIAAQIEG